MESPWRRNIMKPSNGIKVEYKSKWIATYQSRCWCCWSVNTFTGKICMTFASSPNEYATRLELDKRLAACRERETNYSLAMPKPVTQSKRGTASKTQKCVNPNSDTLYFWYSLFFKNFFCNFKLKRLRLSSPDVGYQNSWTDSPLPRGYTILVTFQKKWRPWWWWW